MAVDKEKVLLNKRRMHMKKVEKNGNLKGRAKNSYSNYLKGFETENSGAKNDNLNYHTNLWSVIYSVACE